MRRMGRNMPLLVLEIMGGGGEDHRNENNAH